MAEHLTLSAKSKAKTRKSWFWFDFIHASKFDNQVFLSCVERAAVVINSGSPSDFTFLLILLGVTRELCL